MSVRGSCARNVKVAISKAGRACFFELSPVVYAEAGKIALDYAETIFSSGEELMSVLQNLPTSKRKVLRVGSAATLSRNFQLSCSQPFIGLR